MAAAHDLPVVSLADGLQLVYSPQTEIRPCLDGLRRDVWVASASKCPRRDSMKPGLVHAALTALGRTHARASVIALLALGRQRQLRDVAAKVLEARLRA